MKQLFLFLSLVLLVNALAKAQNTSYDSVAVTIGGVNNVGIGIGVLKINAGLRNVGVGIGALEKAAVSSDNTAIGYHAMNESVGTFYNTAVGKEALKKSQSPYNTALGWGAMKSNVGGESNTATGGLALGLNENGSYNTANGYLSLFSNTNGGGNTGVGMQALFYNSTGNYNTAVGRFSLYNNTGSYNTAHGYESLLNNTTGEANTASGMWALNKNTTGTWNTGNGLSALYHNTTGNSNTALGLQALNNNTTGNNNTATGRDALVNNITGSNNSVFGYGADVLTDGLTNATALGYQAKVAESNAIQLGNAFVSKVFNGVGNNATFITGGLQVTGGAPGIGKVLTSDANGVASWQTPAGGGGAGWLLIGNAGTLDGTNFIGTTDNVPFNIRANNQKAGRIEVDSTTANTFYGFKSGRFNTTGFFNTATGYNSFANNTSGEWNTANGFNALNYNTTGKLNTSVGTYSLLTNTTGDRNTAIGASALNYNTTGSGNTAVGVGALADNLTGTNNTAIGRRATVGNNNLDNATAVGYRAIVLQSNSIQLGNNAVTKVFAGTGTNATVVAGGLQVTGGSPAVGKVLTSDAAGVATWQTPAATNPSWSLTGNAGTVDGTNFIGTTDNVPFNIRVANLTAGRIESALTAANTFYGFLSGSGNTGRRNSAYGYQALGTNTSGLRNTANGAYALFNNSSGSANTASGVFSLAQNTSGGGNTANGDASLFSNTIGDNNTATGNMALQLNTSGNGNTAVGLWALSNNTTGNNNTAVGNNANVNTGNLLNTTALGNGALATQNHMVRLGNPAVTRIEGYVGVFITSDGRFKNNISEKDVKGLDFITRLRPVVYNMDTRKLQKFLTKNMPDSVSKNYMKEDFGPSSSIRQSGFIAQEVEKAAKETGYEFNGVHIPQNENDNYSIAYSQFVVPLVKAVQEQQKMIEDLQKQVKQLQQNHQSNLAETLPAVSSIELSDNKIVVLNQNVPNPFAQQTSISYTIPVSANSAQIIFYSLEGRLMKSANITTRGKGILNVFANDLSSGSYTYSLMIDGKIVDTKKLVKQ